MVNIVFRALAMFYHKTFSEVVEKKTAFSYKNGYGRYAAELTELMRNCSLQLKMSNLLKSSELC